MGGGALEPKTVAGVSKKAFYKKKKKAFTLAEVLITLAIIGVVAALTIPTVVAKYQQKMYYTQFMKAYNTIVNALDLSIVENGTPDTWAFDPYNSQESTKKYIMPYLKINNTCNEDDMLNCVPETYNDLTGKYTEPSEYAFMSEYGESLVFTLSDGTVVNVSYGYNGNSFRYTIDEVFFQVDTNGKKGPNVFGRDLFQFMYENSDNKWQWTGFYDSGEDDTTTCDIQVAGSGFGCAGRLLKEGKMDY